MNLKVISIKITETPPLIKLTSITTKSQQLYDNKPRVL